SAPPTRGAIRVRSLYIVLNDSLLLFAVTLAMYSHAGSIAPPPTETAQRGGAGSWTWATDGDSVKPTRATRNGLGVRTRGLRFIASPVDEEHVAPDPWPAFTARGR